MKLWPRTDDDDGLSGTQESDTSFCTIYDSNARMKVVDPFGAKWSTFVGRVTRIGERSDIDVTHTSQAGQRRWENKATSRKGKKINGIRHVFL